MAKFQVLKYNQITMSWMGIYSKHLATSRKEFFTSISTYIILFCLIVLCIISNGIFVYANFSHFTKVFRSINIFIGGIQGTGMFICIGLNMKKVTQLHLQLQSIVNQGFAFKFFLFSPCSSLFIWSLFLISFFFLSVQSDEIHGIYWKNEQLCRKFTKTILGLYIVSVISIFSTFFIYSIYSMVIGKCDLLKWPLPFDMTVPFDTDTIFGWYTFWFIQMAISIVYGLCTGSIVSYFFCCCLYIATLCDHFGYIVKSIDENIAKYRATTNSWKIGRIIQQIEQQMHDAIKAHIKMNEWECFFFSLESILTLFEFGIKMHQITSLFFRIFSIFSDINSGVIFSLLPINVLFMAVSLYNFEYASIEHLNWQLIDFHFEKKERNIFTRFLFIFFFASQLLSF